MLLHRIIAREEVVFGAASNPPQQSLYCLHFAANIMIVIMMIIVVMIIMILFLNMITVFVLAMIMALTWVLTTTPELDL